MSDMTNIARPYAKAAFEYAVEQNTLAAWQQMLAFAAEVANDVNMIAFLRSNTTATAQADLMTQICGEHLDSAVLNLVRVMAENQRLLALPAVFARFSELKSEYEREVVVEVTSGTELNAAQQDKLVAALSKRLDRKVKLLCSVDASVVSGMIIKAGDMVIDGTVRGKLDRLVTALQS